MILLLSCADVLGMLLSFEIDCSLSWSKIGTVTREWPSKISSFYILSMTFRDRYCIKMKKFLVYGY